jgi:outer membrane protein OmpA-like peptidoglycan-associated protein
MKITTTKMKRHIIVGLALLAMVSLKAQQPGQYLHFNIGGGLNNLSYNLQNGTQKGQFGYSVNAAYSYFFSPQWGLQTGVGIQSFNGSSTLNLSTTSPAFDTDGDAFELGTAYQNWQEKQQTLFVDIPLVGQYRYSVGQKFSLLASVGAKISIPVSTAYKTTNGQIVTKGYYPQWNVELSEMPQYGFGTNTNKYKGNYTLKTAYIAIADVGGLIKLSEKKDLYLGGYFNYGLNNVLTPDNQSVSEQDGTYNGVFISDQVKKVLPVAFGVKVGLYLNLLKEKLNPKVPAATSQAEEIVPHAEAIVPQAEEIVPQAEEIVPQAVKAQEVQVSVVPSSQPIQNQKPAIVEQVVTPVIVEQVVTPVDDSEAKLQAAQNIAESFKYNFRLNSRQPIISHKGDVRALNDFLTANPDITLYLFGYTCDKGSYKVNVRIGKRRASAVKQLLIKDGVPSERMKTISKAYNEPLVPNTSTENRVKNRRVVLKLVKDSN